ncbi:MAG: hypothetical protein H0T11_08310 [Chthoniobacterales bacterium]|nr:hypothetical protein [Chthoniobacterales bacterium]
MRKIISSIVAAFCAFNLAAAASSDQKEIDELYRRGLTGDKAAVEQCIARLEGALETQPGNQLARVYLGSAYTLRSRDLGFGPKKLQVLRQGVGVMNEAVAAAPADPKVRLARALTISAFPAILGYRADAQKDFAELTVMAERSPEKFAEGDLQIVYFEAGNAAKSRDDKARAEELWRKAAEHPADAAVDAKVKTVLNGGR